jgi:predicted phage tail protein
MTEVIIHGEMGKIFGKTHKFKVSKLLEILKALNVTRNGFKNYIINQSQEGINYAMIDPKNPGKKFKSAQEFQEADAPETIHIVPAISGAFVGTFFAVVAPFIKAGVAAAAGFLGSGGFLANLAIGLIIQGIMSLLFPVELPKSQTAETKIDTSSYIFSNLDNNLVQGFPIPLMYGELRVGSNIIGTSVVSEDLG